MNSPEKPEGSQLGCEERAAFGSWRCNCTALEATMEEIPDLCPEHGEPLLGSRTWESRLFNAPLGRLSDHRTRVIS